MPSDGDESASDGGADDSLQGAERADVVSGSPDRSRTWRAVSWLRSHKLDVAVVSSVVAFAVVVLMGYDVPRVVHLAFIGFIVAVFPADRWIRKIVSMLWNPSLVFLVDLDATDASHGGIYRFTSQQFRDDVDVRSGSLDWVSPWLCYGTGVEFEGDPQAISAASVDGTWRGTLSDRELLRALSAVQRCRDQLYRDAQRGFEIESQSWVVVRNAVQRVSETVIETFERGSLPDDGDGITEAVNDALEETNLSRRAAGEDEAPESDVPGIDISIGDLEASPDDGERDE